MAVWVLAKKQEELEVETKKAQAIGGEYELGHGENRSSLYACHSLTRFVRTNASWILSLPRNLNNG